MTNSICFFLGSKEVAKKKERKRENPRHPVDRDANANADMWERKGSSSEYTEETDRDRARYLGGSRESPSIPRRELYLATADIGENTRRKDRGAWE